MIARLAGCLLSLLFAAPVSAEMVSVGVASNFNHTAREIAEAFEAETGHVVRISPSSSGKLLAQIANGAPFDVFLSADAERPKRLESMGLTVPGSRKTYAVGRLVLWSPDARYEGKDCVKELRDGNFSRIAIANPRTAPYGLAAEQVLKEFGLDSSDLHGRIAFGENIAQSLQFTASGSASIGLIAASQLKLPNVPPATCHWEVPPEMHMPIEQQVVLLKRGAENDAARAFVAFLHGSVARNIIRSDGYILED